MVGLERMKARCELVSSSRRGVLARARRRGVEEVAVGQRFRPGARADAMSMPALRRMAATSAVVVVLPAVPVMPMLGPLQRSRNRSPRHEMRVPGRGGVATRGAISVSRRRGMRIGRAGIGIEVGARPHVDPERSELSVSAGGFGPASRTLFPSLASSRASAMESGSKPSRGHPQWDHRRSPSSPARRPASRLVLSREVRCKQAIEGLTTEVTTRRRIKPGARAETTPLPILGPVDEAMARGVPEGVAAGAVELPR